MLARARLVATVVVIVGCSGGSEDSTLDPVSDPLEWVDPTIGSGGFGFAYGSAFPGAAAPHGMVKLGPDTSGEFSDITFLHYSGYWAEDDTILSFSHMHLHGAGLSDYGILGVMPTLEFDPGKVASSDYASTFDKSSELASPGYYGVTLDNGIEVALAATTRTGAHSYSAPQQERPLTLVFDITKALQGNEVDDAEVVVSSEGRRISGRLHSRGGMTGNYGGHDLYFDIRVRQSIARHWAWGDGQAELGRTEASGASVGVAIEALEPGPIELRVGLSLVSAEGATANLEAEMPDWDLAGARASTAQQWRDLLGAVVVEGGTTEHRRAFYSGLYRTFLMPTVMSDVDGQFVFAGQLGQMSEGRFLSDMSLWDTYRTVHPLYDLIAPDSAADSVRSLLAMQAMGGSFPRWPIATGESGTMLGASADVVIADAVVKGVTGFDADDAFDRLWIPATVADLEPSMRGGRSPADDYIELGYVTADSGRSVSTTMEFAIDDEALAAMAGKLGRDDEAALLLGRARGYRELYDTETSFFRPRAASGEFVGDFHPEDFSDAYAEANALQTLWGPIHDVRGLATLVGGGDEAIARLEQLFQDAELDLEENPLELIQSNFGPRTYYWHGNEPDIHAAYFFGQLGRDDLTQRWLQWITDELYSDQPGGLPGNDDGGTMGAWYVFSGLGIYPVAGTERYFVGTPLFPRIRLRLAGGSELVIEAPGLDVETRGVKGVRVDDVELSSARLTHDQLSAAATISFDTAAQPTAWSQPD